MDRLVWGRLGLLVLAAGAVASAVDAQSHPPCAGCVALAVAPEQVAELPDGLNGLQLLIRVAGPGADLSLALLDTVRQRGGRPGLFVESETRPAVVRELAGRADTVILAVPAVGPDEAAFELKTELTALRAAAPSAQLGISGSDDVLSALAARDVAPYIDLVVASGRPPPFPHVRAWRRADLVLDAASAIEATRTAPARHWLWTAPRDPAALRRLLNELSRAAAILPGGLVPSAEETLRCGPRRVETWLNPASLDLVGWLPPCPTSDDVAAPPSYTVAERVVLSSGHSVVRFSSDATGRFAAGVQVSAPRLLSVAEVIARHQAAVARQAATVRTLITTGMLTLTFEAPGFPAPVTITSDSVIYSDDRYTDVEQRNILVNGLAFRGRRVPRLPLLEPERAASLPLAIALTDAYRYTLEAMETVSGTPCYVVAFEPAVRGQTLFRGRAWIAADSFAMVRASAAQTSLRGPIVSSEQIDEFRPVREGIWLLARSDVRQLYEGAGHRTPIQRVLVVDSHDINSPEFARRRATAYASAPVMLRDTPQGYRYLERAPGEAKAGADPAAQTVSTRSDRVRTVAAGVIIDPNISRPLPFAGLSYVDFDLLGTGAQLSGFFGGSYGQLAVGVPSLFGSRWQLGGRAFAIASEFHDRAFADGLERYDLNLRQRPAHVSIWLLRPLTPRLSVRTGYELDYTHFRRAESTAPGFIVPADQVAHGLRLALEGQRAGWSAAVWWNPVVRSGWREWGAAPDDEFDPRHGTFQRYGVSLARAAVLSPALVARAEASWMDGSDLDRFSRYAFGAFDNRLRGYPAALIRYDRGGALRGAVAWAVGGRARLDAFVDNAYVHDPGFGTGFRRFTGIGAAVEVPAPFGTLVAVEWGFGAQGVNVSGRRGTHVVRLTAYKVF